MNDETLQHFIEDYIQAQVNESVIVVWQDGETSILGVAFFEKIV